MTLLVPFDGSPLAEAALSRAVLFGETLGEPVLVVSVIPQQNALYAREHGWLDGDEAFEMDPIVARLREQVAERAPEATFRHEVVSRSAQSGTIARVIRRVARDAGAKIVFVGSKNAGRLVTSLASVGGNVASDPTYDVHIVRQTAPLLVGEVSANDAVST